MVRVYVKVLLLTVLLLKSGTMMAAPKYSKIAEHKIPGGELLTEYSLPNGLHILFLPRHQAKIVTFQAWFRVGSKHEKLDPKLKKTGLAHLFEHMMFRGTDKYPDGKFDEISSRLGAAKQNATTHFYRTNYFESVPSNQFERILELESDRMAHLNFTKESFEKEKGAVVGELRRHLDSPHSIANDELLRLVYQTAPYRYTVLGSEEEIKGFTHDEAKYFYRTFYAPNNATLIIIGDVTEERLLTLVSKYYANMGRQTLPDVVEPKEPAQKDQRSVSITHPQATSEILLMAFRTPEVNSDDIVPLTLLSSHLARGMEAKLRKILVDTGVAATAFAALSYQPDILEIFVQLAEGKTGEEALRIIDKELEALRKKPIAEHELERARNQELLNLYSDIGDNSELASWLGEFLMLSGSYSRGFSIVDGLKKVTSERVQEVANRYLTNQNRSLLYLRPETKTQ